MDYVILFLDEIVLRGIITLSLVFIAMDTRRMLSRDKKEETVWLEGPVT